MACVCTITAVLYAIVVDFRLTRIVYCFNNITGYRKRVEITAVYRSTTWFLRS